MNATETYTLALSIPVDSRGLRPAVTDLVSVEKAAAGVGKTGSQAMTSFAVSTGQAKAGAASMVQQLMDAGVMLGGGMSPFSILITQGPQVATAMSQMGGVMATVKVGTAALTSALAAAGPVLLAIAPAALAAGGALWYANDAMADAAAKADAAAAAATRMANATSGLRDFSRDLRDEVAILNGETTKNQVAARDRVEALDKEASAARGAIQADIDAIKAKDNLTDADMRRIGALVADREALDARTSRMREEVQLLADHADETDRASAAEAKRAQAQANAAQARAEEARRAAERRRAWEEEQRAIEAAQRELDELTAQASARAAEDNQQILDLASGLAALDASTRASNESQLEGVDALIRASANRIESLREEGEELERLARTDEERAAVARATDRAIAAEREATQREVDRREAGERTTGQTAQTALNMAVGGPQAVFANMGPVGAIVSAIVEAVRNLDGIGDMFNDFTVDLNNSIAKLPETLATNLPRWLEEGTKATMMVIPNFIKSLLMNIDDIIAALIGGLMDTVFNPQMWIDMGKALLDGFTSLFKDDSGNVTVGSVLNGLTGGIASGVVKGFRADGAPIRNSGVYYLHEGEEVINRGQREAARQRTAAGGETAAGGRGRLAGSGGRMVIEIDADSYYTTLRELSARGYAA